MSDHKLFPPLGLQVQMKEMALPVRAGVLGRGGCPIEGGSQWGGMEMEMEIEPRVRRNQGGHQETSAFSLLLL